MLNQSPFSLYASAFLNRDNRNANANEPSASTTTLSSQPPLFYSATNGGLEDDEDDPFRRIPGDETPNGQTSRSLTLDEDGVPRLAGSTGSDSHARQSQSQALPGHLDDSDANLQEEDDEMGYPDDDDPFPGDLDALPMMDSDMYDSGLKAQSEVAQSQHQARSPSTQPGWKTHESTINPQQLRQSHALSPPTLPPSAGRVAPPQIPGDIYGYDDDSDDDYDIRRGTGGPSTAAYIAAQSLGPSPSQSPPPLPRSTKPQQQHHHHDPYASDAPLDLPPRRVELNQSLLPRDGVSRTLFYLPDPDRPVGRSKYHDSQWMSAWLAAVSLCALGSVLILFVTNSSPKPPTSEPTTPIPFSTLTHTIPLLTMLTLSSAALSYGFLILFRFAVRPMLILTALSTPLFLFLASAYAFSGSFFSESGTSPTWGESVGLRLFSLVPLGFAYLSAKSFYNRYESLLRTASVIELSTSVLITHPSVLLLSLVILIACFIASLPFLSLALRLLLVGYFSHPPKDAHAWVWHVRNWAGTLALGVVTVWFWSWGIARGTMRVVVGGVVGHWYFTAQDPAYTLLSQQEATRAAFYRASGPSLGSICASALTINCIQLSLIACRWLRRLTTPPQLLFLAPLHPLAFLSGVIARFETFSAYALIYVGITGEDFWTSATKSREYIGGKNQVPASQTPDDDDEEEEVISRRNRRRRGAAPVRRISDYTVLSTLLSLSALSLAVFSAVGGYVFAAHTLEGPTNAPLAALTCGCVTYLTVRFGLGLGEDAADAIFVCYNMDVQAGTKHRNEVFEVLEGRPAQGPIAV